MPHHDHASHPTANQHGNPLPVGHLLLGAHVSQTLYDAVVAWAIDRFTASPRHIIDLGAGPGRATFTLLDRLPGAHVTAIDAETNYLDHLTSTARTRGIGPHVTTLVQNLNDAWPTTEPADLVWASALLHHLSAPETVLHHAHDTITSEGGIVVVEHRGFPQVIPAKVSPYDDKLAARVAEVMSTRGWNDYPDWSDHLRSAGFSAVERRNFSGESTAPRKVRAEFCRNMIHSLQRHVPEHFTPTQGNIFASLTDPHDPLYLTDADAPRIDVGFSVWVGRA